MVLSLENSISPAVLSTETAPPLPSPPSHLLNHPIIQKTLNSLHIFIKVDTPFNMDRLKTLLYDHPNQPFVKSVIHGLQEGFWPFNKGDWKIEESKFIKNFSDIETDPEAIRTFCDWEIAAEKWSLPLPSSDLLPGMKISPMFVAWQKDKPRVITDHSASGLNDGIPKAEAWVKYDNMHPFGQTLYELLQRNPHQWSVIFKSDVSSAFLNLPGHPLWQIWQIIIVDGIWGVATISMINTRHCLEHLCVCYQGLEDRFFINFAKGISLSMSLNLRQNYDNLWQTFHYFWAIIWLQYYYFCLEDCH